MLVTLERSLLGPGKESNKRTKVRNFLAYRSDYTVTAGKGVVLTATWLLPIALIPATWDYELHGYPKELPAMGT